MKIFYFIFLLFVDSYLIFYILYSLPRNRYGWLRFEGFYSLLEGNSPCEKRNAKRYHLSKSLQRNFSSYFFEEPPTRRIYNEVKYKSKHEKFKNALSLRVKEIQYKENGLGFWWLRPTTMRIPTVWWFQLPIYLKLNSWGNNTRHTCTTLDSTLFLLYIYRPST